MLSTQLKSEDITGQIPTLLIFVDDLILARADDFEVPLKGASLSLCIKLLGSLCAVMSKKIIIVGGHGNVCPMRLSSTLNVTDGR